jgi:hypothetical protein
MMWRTMRVTALLCCTAILALARMPSTEASPAHPVCNASRDDVAYLLCRRSRQMHRLCDELDPHARMHCERCFISNNALACEDLVPVQALGCAKVQHTVAACIDTPAGVADECQHVAFELHLNAAVFSATADK